MQTATAMSNTQTVWAIDAAHSTVEFSVKSFFVFIVKGRLTELAGNILLDPNDVRGSTVSVAIRAASVDTGARRRDTRLRSADFLDAERYPDIRFQSTNIEPGRDRDTLRVTGSLVIKGKSRELVLNVEQLDHSRSPEGEEIIYYGTATTIRRADFGIGHGRALFGRALKVVVTIQASRQQ